MFDFPKKNKKKEPESLKEILEGFKKLEISYEKASKELKELKEKNKFSIQKYGILRFNPFKEVGGDQSFSVALLDGNDSGIVLTSHYSRGGNRVYGKPVKEGKSEYTLSEEELKVIQYAKNNGRSEKELNK